MPSLDSITFDTTGFTEPEDRNGMRLWETAEGDAVNLLYFPVPPDIPCDLQNRGRNIPAAMLEPLHPVQIEGFKRMTPAQKVDMVCDLYEAGIQLRVAGLRAAHPDWPPERLDFEARRSLLHAGT